MTTKFMELGKLLTSKELITDKELNFALNIRKKEKKRFGEILISLGYITNKQLLLTLEEQLGVPSVNFQNKDINKEIINLVPEKIARRYTALAFELDKDTLKVAMADPLDIIAIKDIELATNKKVESYVCIENHIVSLLDRNYNQLETTEVYDNTNLNLAEINNMDEELLAEINNAPIVKLVNSVIKQAIKYEASDIHFEPFENDIRIRYRIDGQLIEGLLLRKSAHSAIVTRIKILSDLNIAERRIPQDGRMEFEVSEKLLDLRISILPTIYGEKVVIRLLDRSKKALEIEELGLSKTDQNKFRDIISNPNGIFLVTGPTGSGKTTTLYSILTELNDIGKNIITVEDPVEYRINGINQVQVNRKAGLTFASGLRSILRQDPDIIMIGEIRDSETAQIAVRAAITGHLVLSTVHTNDTSSTISRLIDMGIEPYILSSSIIGIHAQRLVRKICVNCKTIYIPNKDEAIFLGITSDTKLYKGKGCMYCKNTGYKSRLPIHEVLKVNNEMKNMISSNQTSENIEKQAIKDGMSTLKSSARELVLSGQTTVEEIINVTRNIK